MFSKPQKLFGKTMGTRFEVTYFDDIAAQELQLSLQDRADTIDNMMSNWKADSDIMRFNRAPLGEWISLPAELIEVLAIAMEVHLASHGAFDPNVDDLAQAWGFRASQMPDADAIERARQASIPRFADAVEIDAANLLARKTGDTQIDLSGIAKGYGVDALTEVFLAHGIASGMVAIDGDIRVIGTQPDGTLWPVIIEAPSDDGRKFGGFLELENIAVASSGNYRHFHNIDGRRFAHTMNPKSRLPVQTGPAGVTVLHDRCVYADAWATVFMVLDEAQGRALSERLGIQVIYSGEAGKVLPLSTNATYSCGTDFALMPPFELTKKSRQD